ncbi:protein of unknown function [Microlunatus sagamiharensis]|uniref:DUF2382 domain-containing protein n=1 Tax=Microlunatus sagamiharensis TaxID=546874 RepID=A0A1H2NCH8_9ACTN|nr:DUF2382 domain-containing protein [Microlunatus sagamiharensis]SDV02871.1 protein of unknown function [Microlunatus sagamiharensis]
MTGPDESSERTDPWVVRSEERARVAFPVRVRGRVRLTKRVVTEEVTRTFTLRREELVVEELPGDEPGVEPSWDSTLPEQDEELFEVVLHAEQLVPTTVVVPVERIRVGTRVVSTDVVVSADLLRERVGVEQHAPGAATTAGSAWGDAQQEQTGAPDGGARTTKEEHP